MYSYIYIYIGQYRRDVGREAIRSLPDAQREEYIIIERPPHGIALHCAALDWL